MDLKQKLFTDVAIIKVLPSQLSNQKWAKYLAHLLIYLGHLIGEKKMEIRNLLFSL